MAANFTIQQLWYKRLQWCNFKESSHIPSNNFVAHFFALKSSSFIYLHIRVFSWGSETIYVLRDRISALSPTSRNAGGPEECFILLLLFANLPVGMACWIITHARSTAITRRSMLQYIESVYNYSDTEYDSY